MGICRGIQLLNVALGGDIYQDIPSQFPQDFPIAHTQPFDYVIPSHKVEVVPGTLLARLTGGETLQVNSMHHQACRKIAPGLIACGHASGGLTEAIEKPDYPFFLGVQWHPEYLWEQDPAMRQLFEAFGKGGPLICGPPFYQSYYSFFPLRPNFFFRKNGIRAAAASAFPLFSF